MNWEAAGAVGEIVGAIAVVITLAYLAVQVRYAKSAAADSNRLLRATGVREMLLSQVQNDDVRSSAIKLMGSEPYYSDFADKFGVENVDVERLDFIAQYYFWLHWGQFSTTKTNKDLAELQNVVSTFYSTPAIRYAWHHSPLGKVMFEKTFVDFVNQSIGESYDV